MSFLKPIGDVIVKFGQLVYFFMFTSEGAAKLTNQFGVLGFALAYLINPVRTIIWAFQQLKLAWDQWAKSAEGQKVLGELNNAFKEVQSAFKAVWDALKPLGDAFRELWSSITQTSNSAQKASSDVKKAGDSAGGAASPVQIFVEAIKILAWILENVVIPANFHTI